MSVADRRRLEVFSRVRDGGASVAEAARLLGISERQAWRLKARYAREGDGGLVHGLRGQPSNRKTDEAVRAAVLKLYRSKYAGWGPTLACEYLAKEDGRVVGRDTLLRWLRAEGLFERRRKRGKHRSRRPRRERRGELVQMDGSWHDWFGGRGPWCCLMVLIDDATGTTWARFYERETQAAAFDAFGRYALAHGLPRALYVDRAAIYRPDPDAAAAVEGNDAPTQFGRAMATLEVELILANSPQAKGRVERMNGTLQDRLAKELALRGVGDIASANALLDGGFLTGLNAKFAVQATRKRADWHRRVTATMRLDEVLCVHEARAVARDWCVQWRGRLLQVDSKHAGLDLPRPGRRVTVIERLDGTLLVRHEKATLAWRAVGERPAKAKAKRAKAIVNNVRWVPPADHAFRRSLKGVPAAQAASAAPPRPEQRGLND